MLEVCFDRDWVNFDPARTVSTVLLVFVDRARGMFDLARGFFRPCSRFVSAVLELCFSRALGMSRACSNEREVYFDEIELWSDSARGILGTCWRYVLSLLEVCFDEIELCFHRDRGVFRPCSKCFDRVLGRFRSCSMYV